MTLVSSGILNLKGTSGDPTRSIEWECEGNVTGDFSLTTAQGIASAYVGSLPTDMTDFYGYEACTDPTPGTPSSCSGSEYTPNYIRATYGAASDADNYRLQWSPQATTNWQPVSGGGYYDLASTFDFPDYFSPGDYKIRVAGENCSGLGPYRTDLLVVVTG
jgi:hypothetical protein